MKRFTSFVFAASAFSLLLVAGAIAPAAQALPKTDSDFNLLTLRLSELDARNKSEEGAQPYYSQPYYHQTSPQASPQNSTQNSTVEQGSLQTAEPVEPTVWERAETEAETPAPALSITERRQQSLDRRS